MKDGANRRLSNIKTREETGFDFVVGKLDMLTPLGRNVQKNAKPFYPGEDEALEHEFDKLESI